MPALIKNCRGKGSFLGPRRDSFSKKATTLSFVYNRESSSSLTTYYFIPPMTSTLIYQTGYSNPYIYLMLLPKKERKKGRKKPTRHQKKNKKVKNSPSETLYAKCNSWIPNWNLRIEYCVEEPDGIQCQQHSKGF